jgi:hypothetical protein
MARDRRPVACRICAYALAAPREKTIMKRRSFGNSAAHRLPCGFGEDIAMRFGYDW